METRIVTSGPVQTSIATDDQGNIGAHFVHTHGWIFATFIQTGILPITDELLTDPAVIMVGWEAFGVWLNMCRLMLRNRGNADSRSGAIAMTMDEIAFASHLSEQQVRRHIKRLIAAGLIESVGATKGGRGCANTYRVVTKLAEVCLEASKAASENPIKIDGVLGEKPINFDRVSESGGQRALFTPTRRVGGGGGNTKPPPPLPPKPVEIDRVSQDDQAEAWKLQYVARLLKPFKIEGRAVFRYLDLAGGVDGLYGAIQTFPPSQRMPSPRMPSPSGVLWSRIQKGDFEPRKLQVPPPATADAPKLSPEPLLPPTASSLEFFSSAFGRAVRIHGPDSVEAQGASVRLEEAKARLLAAQQPSGVSAATPAPSGRMGEAYLQGNP